MASAFRGEVRQPVDGPRNPQSARRVLDANEEELVPQSKREMLQKRGIQVRAEPCVQGPLALSLQVQTG